MKKIKKVIALVLAGVILFGGMVMGADITSGSAQFDITTKIEQFVGVKVLTTNTDLTLSQGTSMNKAWYNSLTSIVISPVTVGASGSSYVEVARIAYYANTPFKLTVDLPRLSGTAGNSYAIGYASKIFGDNYIEESGQVGITGAVVKTENPLTAGASVAGGSIEINVNEGDYNLAPADTYTATIKFYINAI